MGECLSSIALTRDLHGCSLRSLRSIDKLVRRQCRIKQLATCSAPVTGNAAGSSNEFLLGKQLPYIGVAMVNFVVLFLMAIFLFSVPLTGPFLTLLIATIVYVVATTGFGQLISSFTRTQVAAVFATAILSIVPAVNFSRLFAPVSSLSGGAKVLGLTFPSAWYQPVTVGLFAKALGMPELWRRRRDMSAAPRSHLPILAGGIRETQDCSFHRTFRRLFYSLADRATSDGRRILSLRITQLINNTHSGKITKLQLM